MSHEYTRTDIHVWLEEKSQIHNSQYPMPCAFQPSLNIFTADLRL